MAPPGRPVRAAASGSCAHRSKAYSSARSRRTTPAAAVSEGEWTEERVADWAEVWAAGAAEAAASTSRTLKGAPAVRTARQVPELGCCG